MKHLKNASSLCTGDKHAIKCFNNIEQFGISIGRKTEKVADKQYYSHYKTMYTSSVSTMCN